MHWQQTLLMQVRDDSGLGVGNALLGSTLQPEAGTIVLSATLEADRLRVTVEDDGAGDVLRLF